MKWRIVWAITRKDIVDTLKNQWLVLGLATPIVMALFFRVTFAGFGDADRLTIAVYDPGSSRLIARLRASPDVELIEVASVDRLPEAASGATGGLAVPAGFDAAVDAGARPELTVYRNSQAGFELIAFRQLIEQQVWALDGREMPAQLTFVDDASASTTQPGEEFNIDHYLFSVVLIVAFGMVGNVIVPTLLVEEREKHTLQVLLVSPAGTVEVIAGKALTGMILSLIVAGALLVLNQGWPGDWPVSALVVFLGALFMVVVGLLLGCACRTITQVHTWGTIVMFILLVPIWFSVAGSSAPFETLSRLVPTHYIVEPLGWALAGHVPPAQAVVDLVILAGSTLAVLSAVVWLLRRETIIR